MTTARSGRPRSRATEAIVFAFSICSVVSVTEAPVIVQCPGTGGTPLFSLSQATPTRTAAATTSTGHHRFGSQPFFVRRVFFVRPRDAGRRPVGRRFWVGRRRVVLLLAPEGWEVVIGPAIASDSNERTAL